MQLFRSRSRIKLEVALKVLLMNGIQALKMWPSILTKMLLRKNKYKFKKLKNQYTYQDNDIEENNNNNINNTQGGMMRVCVFCSKLQTNDRLLGIAMTYPNNICKKKK
eukprot:532782_1